MEVWIGADSAIDDSEVEKMSRTISKEHLRIGNWNLLINNVSYRFIL